MKGKKNDTQTSSIFLWLFKLVQTLPGYVYFGSGHCGIKIIMGWVPYDGGNTFFFSFIPEGGYDRGQKWKCTNLLRLPFFFFIGSLWKEKKTWQFIEKKKIHLTFFVSNGLWNKKKLLKRQKPLLKLSMGYHNGFFFWCFRFTFSTLMVTLFFLW